MSRTIPGIHHVTAIAGDPQQNVDFYTGVLGLRLVKLTVNFDDPGAYHLYYGDEVGHPGTILTFFSWPGAVKGRRGTGQIVSTSFSVPDGALGFWMERLKGHGVPFEGPAERFDEQVVTFFDPDDLQLELIAHPGAEERSAWEEGPVPPRYAIRGFYGVTLLEEGFESTDTLLTDTLGFRLVKEAGNWFRYQAGDGDPAALADVRVAPNTPSGRVAVGTVHHVAWRTPNDAEQGAWRTHLAAQGINVTPVMDRQYFHSIYFREPGGVLFEIATDPPGFTVDEPVAQLGTGLRLPPWLEPKRTQITQLLPPLRLPQAGGGR